MNQRMRNVAIFVGGTLLVGSGFLAAACSTDNGETETPLPKADAGTTKKDGGGSTTEPGTDGSTPIDDGGTTTAADCGTAPKLRDNTNTFYCPFRHPPDGGVDSGNAGPYCNNNEVCCNPDRQNTNSPFPDSFCAVGATGTSCQTQATAFNSTWQYGGSAWECADKNQCAANQVCCLTTAPDAGQNVNIGNTTNTSIPKACDAKQAFKFGGTKCAASCAAGSEIKLCSLSDQNCPAGQTCTPFTALSRDLGYCK